MNILDNKSPGSRPDGSGPAVDLDALRRRLGGDGAGVESVLAAFTREAPAILNQLTEATDAREGDRARRLAHSLKGSLLWIGADRAAGAAADFEKNPAGEDRVASSRRLAILVEEVRAVLHELKSPQAG